MNAERLHLVVRALNNELNKPNIPQLLEQLAAALQSQVNAPQDPVHQQGVASTLTTLEQALSRAPSNSFNPGWIEISSEVGLYDLTGERLATRIREIFSRNQITPSVALAEIQKAHQELAARKTAVDGVLGGFKTLKIGMEKLDAGSAELGVLIPRAAVDNTLTGLQEELREIDFVLRTLAEFSTGQSQKFEVRTISSSDFQVFLDMGPQLAAVAVAVERLVNLYKTLLEVRALRKDLKSKGVPDKSLSGVDDHAAKVMEDGIAELVEEFSIEYRDLHEKGRMNELRITLTVALRKLANRIDKGVDLEVRVGPPEPAASPEEQTSETKLRAAQFARMQESASRLSYLDREGEPILQLPEGEPERSGGRKRHSPPEAG
jgi:hypothetical protein